MAPDQELGNTTEQRVMRLARPSVVVLCGPAACGKSTFAARHFRPTQIISSDCCRALICDDERDQRFQSQAFSLLHFIVEQRLALNRLCVVDSTALTPSARKSLLELARRYHVPCEVLLFEVPLETCVARDQDRGEGPQGRAVGRPVIERQYRMFEEAKLMIPQEGFDRLEILREQELPQMRFEVVFRPSPRSIQGPRETVSTAQNPTQGRPRRSVVRDARLVRGQQALPGTLPEQTKRNISSIAARAGAARQGRAEDQATSPQRRTAAGVPETLPASGHGSPGADEEQR